MARKGFQLNQQQVLYLNDHVVKNLSLVLCVACFFLAGCNTSKDSQNAAADTVSEKDSPGLLQLAFQGGFLGKLTSAARL